MNTYNPNIHHRRSIRLKGYNYSQAGLYFITLCCQDRACLFGEIENGKMKLNIYGQIAWQEWQATEIIRNNTALHEFIVMPNHIHGIIEILFHHKGEEIDQAIDSKDKIHKKSAGNEGELPFAPAAATAMEKFKSPSQTIGAIIRGYKIATIKKIKDTILNSGSTGEFQFAPTEIAPTEEIIQLDFKIWQRNYYEHIIRDEKSYHAISEYIINNPAKWARGKFNMQ